MIRPEIYDTNLQNIAFISELSILIDTLKSIKNIHFHDNFMVQEFTKTLFSNFFIQINKLKRYSRYQYIELLVNNELFYISKSGEKIKPDISLIEQDLVITSEMIEKANNNYIN